MIEHPKPGQIVTHVASTWRMTVHSYVDVKVFCRWFRDDVLCSGWFMPAVLNELEQPGGYAAPFKPGAVVQLRTGGPVMAIVSIESDSADCEWFDRDGALQSCGFVTTELQPFVPSLDPPTPLPACWPPAGPR